MPTDACQYFYECNECKEILRPKSGDCCVYCSFGTVPCPPIQENGGKNCGNGYNLEEIFIAHAKDEKTVFHMNGCTGGDIFLRDFMEMVVSPQILDLECKKFTISTLRKIRRIYF